jgi:AraC family transcriptional regulator
METQTAPTPTTALLPTRFEDAPALRLAGLKQHYTLETREQIPALWARFVPYLDAVPGRVSPIDYGVILDSDEGQTFDYMAAFEVSLDAQLPAEFATLDLPAQKYAVFAHEGHVSTLCDTIFGMFTQWLPESGYEATGQPDFFERYGEQFNPETGTGDLELWLPVRAKGGTA